jgi:hypothetical protein
MDDRERSLYIDGLTPRGGLYTEAQREVHPSANSSWRVSPDPFWMPASIVRHFEALGKHLYSFYRASNQLYWQSFRGIQPRWAADYLDVGKPDEVIGYGRVNRFKQDLPGVIRPDIIPTKEGMIASELDSIPGGIGFTGSLADRYARLGADIVGGPDGMVSGFRKMIASVAKNEEPVLGVIVSEESDPYRNEMQWLVEALDATGLEAYVLRPEDVVFTEEGLFAPSAGGPRRLDIVYRFFELFDLKNIPKIDLILYAMRKRLVQVTPPLKAYLEEKMLMALFHHPMLERFWVKELGEEAFDFLGQTFPKTWILDSRSLPPHAVIPGLEFNGEPVSDWRVLGSLHQKERHFVVKPSGFSESAWGSRGVSVGHDMSEQDWQGVMDSALAAFDTSPAILQEFHTASRFKVSYYDFETEEIQSFRGRPRLQPYYFVVDGEPILSGIQATVCPPDKKLLHGMVDAVVVPAALKSEAK